METGMITDQQAVNAYKKTGNIWRAADLLGICAESVRARLKRAGISRNGHGRTWSAAEDEKLWKLRELAPFATLNELALFLTRSRSAVAHRVSKLGMGDYRGSSRSKYDLSEDEIRRLFERFRSSRRTLQQFARAEGMWSHSLSVMFRKRWPDEWEIVMEAKSRISTPYRIGRAFEYRVRDWLIARNYWLCRAARSKGPVDLVAIRKGEVLFIQCKTSGDFSAKERYALVDLAESVGAIPLLAARPTGRKLEFKLLSKRSGRRPFARWLPQ